MSVWGQRQYKCSSITKYHLTSCGQEKESRPNLTTTHSLTSSLGPQRTWRHCCRSAACFWQSHRLVSCLAFRNEGCSADVVTCVCGEDGVRVTPANSGSRQETKKVIQLDEPWYLGNQGESLSKTIGMQNHPYLNQKKPQSNLPSHSDV